MTDWKIAGLPLFRFHFVFGNTKTKEVIGSKINLRLHAKQYRRNNLADVFKFVANLVGYCLEKIERMISTFPTQFVFLPGLGANHRLFRHQTVVFPNSYAADWIDPLPDESLEQYAVRWAEMIRTELEKRPPAPVIVCGVSLGGMVAPYVARHLNAVGCVLLCSIRGPKEFPQWSYLDWWFMRHCFPLRMVRACLLQLGARFLLLVPGLRRRFVELEVGQQMTEMPIRCFAGLTRMMFDWAYRRREETEAPVFSGPTLQIHGARDLLLPIRLTSPDISIPGGMHTLTLTHPGEINEILERFAAELKQK